MAFISYAQNFEDVMLWRMFKQLDTGFYIDVGAAHPDSDSVTRAFYDHGWHGINVEPSTEYYTRLANARRRDINLNVALGDKAGPLPFFQLDGTGLSTLDPAAAKSYRANGRAVTEHTVVCHTLAEISHRHAPPDVHFLKVDVEGSERQVLAGADFGTFRPWVVLVEATLPMSQEASYQEWEPILITAGYQFVYFDGLNRFYLAQEHHDRLAPSFRLPPNIFDDFLRPADSEVVRRTAELLETERLAATHQRAEEQQHSVRLLVNEQLSAAKILAEEKARTAELLAKQQLQAADFLARERLRAAQEVTKQRIQAIDAAGTSARLSADLQRVRNEQQAQAAWANNLQQEVQHLNARLSGMFASTSWRITAPLRAMKQMPATLRTGTAPRTIPNPPPLLPAPMKHRSQAERPRQQPETEQLVKYIEAMHASTSWRLTRPLRLAKTLPLRLLGRAETGDGSPPTSALTIAPYEPPLSHIVLARPDQPILTVHQFHSGSAVGDAITNGMLLTREWLKNAGYHSEIFVEHRDPALAGRILLIDDLPVTENAILIVHHSMGHDAMNRILALPARKILLYHNITPPELLTDTPWAIHYAQLGRLQLAQMRPHMLAALADSEYNAMELRSAGYASAIACTFLIDVDALTKRAQGHDKLPEGTPFTILFVGRVVASKGQADLVDAFAMFSARWNKPCRLLLVGHIGDHNASYPNEVRERIRQHGLQDHVTITGPVTDAQLHDFYRQAHLYVSLSHHEGFGLPLVEAMAHHVPVIAWPAGAVPYTLGHEPGDEAMLLADRSPATAAATMLHVAEDPALTEAMIARQLKVLERFRLDRQIPRLVQALVTAGAAPPEQPETRRAIQANLHIAVTGHVHGSYSLALVNRGMALALESRAPGRTRLIITEPAPKGDPFAGEPTEIAAMAARPKPPTGPEIVISQNYPVLVPEPPVDLAIAFMFWEESLLPETTVVILGRGFGRVLAPARFVAKVLIDSGVPIPVETVGFAPRLSRFFTLATERPAARRTETFTFLHVSSCFPRKGVDCLLIAFAQAFRKHDAVRLVIKGFPNPHNDVPEQIEALRRGNPDIAEIVMINEEFDDAAMLELYRQADAMVLPTRGEGFNIPAAEAMAAGIPLIVTGFGGHLDFCTAKEARLLKFRFASSQSHLATPGSVWVEPDLDDLAAALRELFTDISAGAGAAAVRATAAIQAVRTRLNPADWADRVAASAIDGLVARPLPPLRVAWISSWDVACGIAEYSRFLVTAMTEQHDTRMAPPLVLADDRTAAALDQSALRVQPAWQAGLRDSMPRLARAVANEDPDVVVIQHQPGFMHWHALADLLADQRLVNRITVVTLHAAQRLLDIDQDERTRAVTALASASRVLVHRIPDLELLHNLGLTANVTLFPQGAPRLGPDASRPARELSSGSDPLIGCYGFFLPGKGIPRLIEAAAALRRNWPKLRLRLVNAAYPAPASTQEIATCRALATSLGMGNAIDWLTGFSPNDVSVRQLSACDLLVMPYDHSRESSSAALRGAMVSGVPLAVTPIALFDEAGDAVHRLAGLDVASLTDGIDKLLCDQPARTHLKQTAARWLADNAWDLLGRRMAGMLLGLRASGIHHDTAPTTGWPTTRW